MFAVYAYIFVTVATAAIVSPDGALAALARAQSLAGDAILLGQALAYGSCVVCAPLCLRLYLMYRTPREVDFPAACADPTNI